MRTPALVGMSAVSGAVLLVALHAGQAASGVRPGHAVAAAGVVVAAAPTRAPKTAPVARPAFRPAAVNGISVDTRYGPVQVQITVRGTHITKADALAYPQQPGRDQEINGYAVPLLDQQVVQGQGARIDTVSGATYTSEGYRTSLQSALDAAHRAGLL